MSDTALMPLDERQVDFYGDELTAALVEANGRPEIYVPLRPIVEYLGLSWAGQYERLQRDAILAEAIRGVRVTRTPGSGGGSQEMTALPLKFLPGFLFGISVNRVREELRERILRYQRECYDALWDAFQEGRLTGSGTLDELLAADSPAVQTYHVLQAMVRLARNQVLLENRLAGQDDRLEEIESTLRSPRTITAAQASRISQAVKAIAMQLSERTGRNEYGGVYGELYRRFEIPSYRELPAKRFDEAMKWLTDWWAQIAGDEEIPF